MLSRGDRFIQSLNDERCVLLEGKKLTDLAGHPAFKGSLETITHFFNLLDNPIERENVGLNCLIERHMHTVHF